LSDRNSGVSAFWNRNAVNVGGGSPSEGPIQLAKVDHGGKLYQKIYAKESGAILRV
jgi:hypothetical protein